ncbi:uncharacterized protein LOC128894988 isoform X2 [Hylaeus anthracinus]|uniref:uncharacterized protein LOC128884941 isoform X2 n=1 Tax=Hylaeus volcanicus TaxID=313075 RepID=UPI0023B812BF|nr:uncharacterized protein LOC128884941 isoform X2 [Hylaeus volcanicus]XP_054013120.1 uncharacterized protein LOC128894988 isoform X2 [Hylaeus anthracinus]
MNETRHHLHSVSDLYAADEIEVLLLEEIRDLELPPSAYSRPEDIQDFEIAGSRTGGQISSQPLELDSPGVHSTVHSWDSHANYHGQYDYGDHHGSSSNPLAWPRASHLVLYCDIQGHFKTAIGVVRLLLLISSAACLATLCSSGTAKVSLFMLPLVGRLRFMIFVAVFCFLVTALLLFLDISHVVYVFPLNWAKLNAWVFTGIGLSYALSSALLACSIWEYHSGGWVPKRTRSQLSAAAALGLSCAILAFLLSWIHGRSGSSCRSPDSRNHTPTQLYKPVDNSSSSGVTLKERSPKRPTSWVVKNQQSKKQNADSDTNTNNGHHDNDNHAKYKQGVNRKDHWASARQHFLPSEENTEDNQRDDVDIERRRRRRRRDGDTSSTGDGNLISTKTDSGHITDDNKTRRVPRKLPLQSVEQSRPWPGAEHRGSGSMQVRNKSSQMPVYGNVQGYCGINESSSMQVTQNGFHWEMECTSTNSIEKAETTMARTAMWSGQWQPPPDDVQPCSSKTIDPYDFA